VLGSVSWLALAALLPQAALAEAFAATHPKQAPGQKPDTLLQADQLSYDQTKQKITAIGHVEIVSGEQILKADKVTYDQKRDVVHATGNVSVLQPNGDVVFADTAEVTSDLKQGFVNKVGVLFGDNSRMAAQDAQRYEGRYLVAQRGVYTACNLCEEDPTRAPLWQLKAKRVTHDNVAKDVIYRDAWLEFGGIPVAFTPYFSHPDPTVQRRQGFLFPTVGSTRDLGFFTRVPYYFDIAPNTDATLSPAYSQNDGLQFAGQLRHRFSNGRMQWDGSFVRANLINEFGRDEGEQWRGHLFGSTLFNLSNVWRAGTDVAFTSDKSYLRRYRFSSDDILVNRAFLEGFQGRHYAGANMYYFQDLRPGRRQEEPFVAPELSVSALGEPGKTLGGRWSLNGGFLATSRNSNVATAYQGPDTRRLSAQAGWDREFVSSTGFLTTLSGLARADGYWSKNVMRPGVTTPTSAADFQDIAEVRQFAQGSVQLRYPLGRRGDHYQQIAEPIGIFTVAPRIDQNSKLPNEDSLDVEFDETNLFRPNRYTGYDRIEGGTRAAYGLRHSLISDNGARADFVGGQVFRLEKDTNFPGLSGLRNTFSDYVGRLDLEPGPWFDANYGFRLDRDNLKLRRQELQSSAGVPLFRPFIRYVSVDQTEVTTGLLQTVEEVTAGFDSHFLDYWSLSFAHNQALQPIAGARTSAATLAYQDECARFGLTLTRDNTNRADLKSGTSVVFSFFLRNIGGLDSVGAPATGSGL
jgi:LPS-assembly protein